MTIKSNIGGGSFDFEQAVSSLRDVKKIQCSEGNWNYDPYMHGMANGLILALSMFEAGEVEFLNAPDVWCEYKKEQSVPTGGNSMIKATLQRLYLDDRTIGVK